jgi:hypothetical protein
MRRFPLTTAILLAAWSSGTAIAAPGYNTFVELTAEQAPSHIGETATVCGTVASAKYSAGTKRQPTFLDFDRPYPQQVFTVVIWGTDRPKFASPEVEYLGKRACATGVIQSYKGRPEIVVSDPGQLTMRRGGQP